MAEVVLMTSSFTVYKYPDRVEIYNAWDVERKRGLILTEPWELEDLAFICKIGELSLFSKRGLKILTKTEGGV
jgi:hypothetical protein